MRKDRIHCTFLGIAPRIVIRHRQTAKNKMTNNKRLTIRALLNNKTDYVI